MSNFDQMLRALQEDCDAPTLADAAELRRLGAHRTAVHRAVGGAATLAVAAGVTTGIVLLGATTPAYSPTEPATSAGSATAVAISPTAVPAPTASAPAPSAHPSAHPSSTERSTTTGPRNVTAPSGTPACIATNFNVRGARIQSDDASAIIGYDIVVKYVGKQACKLSQRPRVYYTTVNGQTLPFGLDTTHPQSTKSLTVNPGRTVSVNVAVNDGRNDTPVPPACASEHLYKGLAVSIDGRIEGLSNGSMTFPCTGAGSGAWTLANGG